jgi:hypothetical protein
VGFGPKPEPTTLLHGLGFRLFHFINRECDKTIQHGHYFLQQEHKVFLSGFTIQLFIKIFCPLLSEAWAAIRERID